MTLTRSALAVQPDLPPLGVQQARISSVPPYVSSAGTEAIQAYELTGRRLDDWQKAELIGACGERADGRWAAFEVVFNDPRQNGKDEELLALELAGLFVWGERLIGHSAHLFDTAMEHLERLAELIENVPEFAKRCRSSRGSLVNRSHGREGITLKSGARIRFRARTRTGSFRGFTGDRLIFNEAMDLPDEVVGAIMPVLSARSTRVPGPQVVYAGSPVDQTTMPNGLVFARLREAGISGNNERLAYFEHSADVRGWLEAHGQRFDPKRPEIDQVTLEMLGDPEMWAQANPALGVRIAHEHVLTEFRSPSMAPRQFAVERLGIGDYPDTSEDAGRIISREAWAVAAEHDPANRITASTVFAVDANPAMTWATIAVAGKRADGRFNGAIVDHHPDTDWLVARCLELKRENPRMRVVIHKQGPLGSHIDDFTKAKIKVIEANTEDYSRACTGFVAGVLEGRFRYPFPQPELDTALSGARKKETAESTRWTRADAESEISPLVATSLAYWAAEQRKGAPRAINLSALEDD